VEKYEIDDEFWQKFREYCTLYENQNALPFNNAYMICKFVFDQGSFNYLLTHRNRGVISMLQKHGFNELFKDFVTQEDGFPRKPDPAGLNHLIEKYNMNKNETLYIGDREVDMQCAKAAGVKSCFFSENINLSFKADFRMQNFSDFYYMLNSTLSTAEKGNRTDE
jgi:HAD superfamily hydrolase (TIGR01549 family)